MLQQMSQTGRWWDVEAGRADALLALVVEFEAELPAAYLGRPPLQTIAEVQAHLAAGERLVYGTDWYNVVRNAPTAAPRPEPLMVRCDCGHSVPQGQVMSASLGTSCVECYDRMSG